ncbi:MAG: DNA recombination protein RmuC [Verrucomicrobia bacterium ADurb.Bin345]|nr:MAG: DNA recombination protein RmuC [Verrucomicrobia bacterium ADurb.Bin345]
MVIAVAIVVIVAAIWIRASVGRAIAQPRPDQGLALLQNQVNALNAQMAQALDQTRKSLDQRLDNAAQVIQGVSKQLGQLDESSRRIFEIGKDMAGLQEVLRSPKLRGNLSELFLGELLAQILPSDHYRMQYAFRGGETVDAIIVLKAGFVPVDAKFPLENFRKFAEAQADEEKKNLRRTFVRDVKVHIDAIATKYIRTDEGTFDFALMYIPAENVYYETIIKDDDFGGEMSLFNYALAKRVIPVSPNSFYAYLQTILLGLKGLRVEESAREMLNRLAGLRKEFERFEESFRLVGQHLENAAKKFGEAEKRFGKLDGKLEQVDGIVKGLEPGAGDQESETGES